MKKMKSFNPVILGKPLPSLKLAKRAISDAKPIIPPIDPGAVMKAYLKTPAGKVVADKFPDIVEIIPSPIAGFTPSSKSGSAVFLDIWDCDHFDFVTDMGSNLSQNRVWFSSTEHAGWGSGLTKTGRINCTFNVPETRMYRCDATLQSTLAPAVVECILDNSSFGTLNVGGTITQPHFRTLAKGSHQFRIEQRSGSLYFLSLMVYAV